jgi:lysophospholipase L1-like esterase
MRLRSLVLARRSTVAAIALASTLALSVLTLGEAEPASSAAASRSPMYYVSLGDSYSVGYQSGSRATPGYSGYVAKHTGLTLADFGCSGATTTTILSQIGCLATLPGTPGGMAYTMQTQIYLATIFIRLHRGHIGLITVTIGLNDVVPCAAKADPMSCITTAVAGIKTNVTSIAAQLRAAAGPNVPIIGSTYPDVVLGAYVYPTHPAPAVDVYLAKLFVKAFKTQVNPALSQSYASSLGAFVDVTKASGAYGSLNRTVHTKAYGTIPVPVESLCSLTWYCAKGNIHPNNAGYTLIGKLLVAKYDAMTKK